MTHREPHVPNSGLSGCTASASFRKIGQLLFWLRGFRNPVRAGQKARDRFHLGGTSPGSRRVPAAGPVRAGVGEGGEKEEWPGRVRGGQESPRNRTKGPVLLAVSTCLLRTQLQEQELWQAGRMLDGDDRSHCWLSHVSSARFHSSKPADLWGAGIATWDNGRGLDSVRDTWTSVPPPAMQSQHGRGTSLHLSGPCVLSCKM